MQIDSFPPHPWIAFARATATTTSFSFIRWKSHFNSKKLPATSDVSSRWMHYWQKVAPLLNTPFSMFVAAFLMLDARCSMLDAWCLIFDWKSGKITRAVHASSQFDALLLCDCIARTTVPCKLMMELPRVSKYDRCQSQRGHWSKMQHAEWPCNWCIQYYVHM